MRFQMEYKQAALVASQETWAERFNRCVTMHSHGNVSWRGVWPLGKALTPSPVTKNNEARNNKKGISLSTVTTIESFICLCLLFS